MFNILWCWVITQYYHKTAVNDIQSLVKAISRHTVVCRAAQEAGTQHREYIDRKKENAIFAPP